MQANYGSSLGTLDVSVHWSQVSQDQDPFCITASFNCPDHGQTDLMAYSKGLMEKPTISLWH